MSSSDRPRFERLDVDHAIHVVADYVTEGLKRKRKGDLAYAHLEIASALRDLVRAAAREAARQVREEVRRG